jgi:hypothetical protein
MGMISRFNKVWPHKGELLSLSRPNVAARVKVDRFLFRLAKLSSQIAIYKAILTDKEPLF